MPGQCQGPGHQVTSQSWTSRSLSLSLSVMTAVTIESFKQRAASSKIIFILAIGISDPASAARSRRIRKLPEAAGSLSPAGV